MHLLDDTIVAMSTPVGEGGIGIVRLSGKDALKLADRIFVSKDGARPSDFKTHTLRYGHVVSLKRGRKDIIDEVMLTVMRAPKTYTKEDVVEINCHGGIVAMRKVMELCLERGARIAEPGEFTKRAFLNGRIDLSQAEAVLDIIRAKTESALGAAMRQLDGIFSKNVNSLREELLELAADLEAGLDFSEEDIEVVPKERIRKTLDEALDKLDSFIDTYHEGMIIKEGILCVICGKPNVGKSSLMNALLRHNRVIVTPLAGTTRDAIEEYSVIGGIPIRIADTAGIAKAKNAALREGVTKSRSYIRMADLVIFMLDMSANFSKKDNEINDFIGKKDKIVIANKSDLKKRLDIEKAKKITGRGDIIEASVLNKKDVDKIEKAIADKIWKGGIKSPEGALVTSLRHKKALVEARQAILDANRVPDEHDLVSQNVREAAYHLGAIIGKSIDEEILDRIFEKFCVGK